MNADFAGIDLTNEPAFLLGGAEVRPASREVIWSGERHLLEPRVMQVLVALATRRGRVVSRDELIALCWGGRIVGDDAINRCVAALRRLAERGAGFAIETIARVGYRLTEEQVKSRRPPRRRLVIAAVAALAFGVIGGLAVWRHSRLVTVAAEAAPVIAVLPFDAMDPSQQSATAAESMDARIGDALTRGGMSVIARATTQRFRGGRKAAAARELRAPYLVDGDVSATREGMRVSARVIDATSGLTLWSDAIVSPPGSDPAPEQMARAIAGFLTWPTMARALSSGREIDAQMAADVWRDLELMQRGDTMASYALARRMSARYPDAVPAQIVWAVNAGRALPYLSPRERASAISGGRAAARRAIGLSPRSGDAYAGLAALTPPVAWSSREELFLNGLAVDADNATVENMYGSFLANAGRLDEAVAAGKRATTLDQVSPIKAGVLATSLYADGQTDEATALAVRATGSPNPDRLAAAVRFSIAAWSARPRAAETLLSDSRLAKVLEATSPQSPLRLIARAVATNRATDRDAAARGCAAMELRDLEALECLVALTRFGRIDQAFELAERPYPDLRAPDAAGRDARWIAAPLAGETAILFSPPMAAFRADPRFRELTERVGLAEYWRRSKHWPDVCRAEHIAACTEGSSAPSSQRRR